MLCANCFAEIKDEPVLCASCGQPMHKDCIMQCIKCGKPLCDICAGKSKWKCSECEQINVHEMEYISSTMFESFLKCPYMFKELFIINKNIEIPNKWSRIGQELHALFDKWSYEDEKDYNKMIAEFIPMYQSIDKNLFDNEEERVNFFKTSCDTIKNWIETETVYPKPLYTEQRHFVKLHDELPPIRVTIDRINGDANDVENWEVQDYKTGKVYTAKQIKENMQLPIYAMAIKAVYGALPKSLRLRFPQHKKERLFMRLDDDTYECVVSRGGTYTIKLSETLDKMIDIYNKIKKDSFKPNTQDSFFCDNFCPLMKEGKCYGTATKWKLLNQRGY